MSNDEKPRKIKKRRATGRVSGTTQSSFATGSMSSILRQQQEGSKPSAKPAAKKADDRKKEETAAKPPAKPPAE